MKHLDHLNELVFLIDAASRIAGNDAKLAAALGQHRSKVSDWRKARQPCPPEMQVLMAALAGFDPQATAARALVEKHEGTPLGDQLMRALGKGSRAIGAALGFAGASLLAIYSLHPTTANAKAADEARQYNVHKRNRRYVKRGLTRA